MLGRLAPGLERQFMLLAAISHVVIENARHVLPVRVVRPKVIQSLPPVTIGHVAEGPNLWFAFAAAIGVSVVAVIIASITLRKVNSQIEIANRQLGVAKDELKAVKDDFALAKQQFDLAEQQFREVTRRPQLDITVEQAKAQDIVASSRFSPTIWLRNSGERNSESLLFELLVPIDDFDSVNQGVQRQGIARVDDQHRYMSLGMEWPATLYPNHTAISMAFPVVSVKDAVEASELLIRVYDREFAYPKGRLRANHFLQAGSYATAGVEGTGYPTKMTVDDAYTVQFESLVSALASGDERESRGS